MISDLDAFRAAKLFLEQHGKDAVGAIVWRAILGAIEVLQRQRREDEALH